MEAILNIIWLAVAVAVMASWWKRWLPIRQRSNALPEFIALVCALALLFPSVSLTDDLHPDVVAVDAASGKRNSRQLIGAPSHAQPAPGNIAHSVAAVAPHPTPLVQTSSSRLILQALSPSPKSWHATSSGRAPPALASFAVL